MKISKKDEKRLEFYRKYIGKGAVKKSLIMIILWLLSKEKLHGYKIIDIIQKECHLNKTGASEIYPILKKLEKDGFIDSEKEKQGKRVKKVYSISKKGREMIAFSKRMFCKSRLIRKFFKEMMG